MSVVEDRFIQYGVASDLAEKAVAAGLTVTKVRSLSQKDMVSKFGMTADEAKELSRCVQRVAIDKDIIQHLLEASNFTCNVCKGQKGLLTSSITSKNTKWGRTIATTT